MTASFSQAKRPRRWRYTSRRRQVRAHVPEARLLPPVLQPRRPDEAESKYSERYQEWRERLEKVHGLGEIIIAKQRHGPIGAVKLHFDAETTKFDNYLAPDHMPDF